MAKPEISIQPTLPLKNCDIGRLYPGKWVAVRRTNPYTQSSINPDGNVLAVGENAVAVAAMLPEMRITNLEFIKAGGSETPKPLKDR